MTRFVFSYDDIERWLRNFLSIDGKVEAYNANCGELVIASPSTGIRKLLPDAYRGHKQEFYIEGFDTTSVTISLLKLYGEDELYSQLLTKYVNYCMMAQIIEEESHGKVHIHLDRIGSMRHIALQTVQLTAEGLEIDFDDNPTLYEHMRMLQMLLRAGYTEVRTIPEDMPYHGYWFKDGILEYTLITAEHPADMRLQASVHVMEWLGLGYVLHEIKEFFRPIFPMTHISYKHGEVTIVIPMTIAESEINAQTMERNCSRMKEEAKGVMMEIMDYLQTSEKDLL